MVVLHHVGDAQVADVGVGVESLPGGADASSAVDAVEEGLGAISVRHQHVHVDHARRPAAHEQQLLVVEQAGLKHREVRALLAGNGRLAVVAVWVM